MNITLSVVALENYTPVIIDVAILSVVSREQLACAFELLFKRNINHVMINYFNRQNKAVMIQVFESDIDIALIQIMATVDAA